MKTTVRKNRVRVQKNSKRSTADQEIAALRRGQEVLFQQLAEFRALGIRRQPTIEDIWENHSREIAEIEKRRVILALKLQRVNREREFLREKITAAGGGSKGRFHTDHVDLLGQGLGQSDEVFLALKRLLDDHVVASDDREIIDAIKGGFPVTVLA